MTIAVAVTKRTSTFKKLNYDTGQLTDPCNFKPCLLQNAFNGIEGAKKSNVFSPECAHRPQTMIQAGGVPPTKSWPLMATCQLQSYPVEALGSEVLSLSGVICICLLPETGYHVFVREFRVFAICNAEALRSRLHCRTQREKG